MTSLTVNWQTPTHLAIILWWLFVSNGCMKSPVVVLLENRQIRAGSQEGWVEVSEGYLRELIQDLQACDEQRTPTTQHDP